MGSSHKTTAKVIKMITEESDFNDMNDPHLFTIDFGGLHILKSPTNHLRNNVLCLNGENCGVHILGSLKNAPVYALKRTIQWMFPKDFASDKYLSILGGLHIEQSALVMHEEMIKNM